ncbi:LacI family DNA-binding transcriptional regulator [Gammaproteobacteria bacterium]|nr:LacI family DNA-binding transcriptional regulator [Gammaproteobacteria bacterium]
MTNQPIRNMEQFAAMCGVSRPTVSKYFHDPSSVRVSIRARIEAALELTDYRPNIFAVNQNRQLTKYVGIVVPYLSDPVFGEMARLLERRCVDAGFSPILLSSHGVTDYERNALDSLRALKPAGALLAPLGRRSDLSALKKFSEAVPTVLFDSFVDGVGEAFIGHDNPQSTLLICDYLCRTGEPPVFFEMKNPINPNAYRRRQSYCDAMQALGHEPRLIQAEGEGWDFERIGYSEGRRVIASDALLSNTVLCSNDRLAIGFIAAAFEEKCSVGRGSDCTLRVAGHDNHPFARYTSPPLTTVSHDYTQIAERSVETLFTLVETGEVERQVRRFKGQLVMRESA